MAPGACAEKNALATRFQSLLGRSTSSTCSCAAVSCAECVCQTRIRLSG